MALYIDKKIEDPLAGPQKTLLTWHKCFPIVAVASYDDNSGGVVSIYTNDCSVVRTKISPRLGIQVTAVEWHPTKKCMVIGWESGDLAIWSEIGGREIYSFTKHHNNVVCSLAFNENGKFFVTGDIDGSMFVWKFDAGGSFEIVLTQSLKYSIVDMVFRTNCNRENEGEISRLARAAVDGDERALNMFSSWEDNEFEQRLSFVNKDDDFELFVGCQSGIVFFMKKNGYCEGVLQMETSIRYLAYYQEKDILIVLSKSLILAQFSIEQDGSVRELRKIKLSGRNTDVVMVWAGESLLAISTGENSVHLWNVNSGQSSTLVIPDFALSQQITHISFMAARNVLTAGTIHGFLFSWQLIDVDDDDEIVWEVEKLLQVHGNIRSFGWCEALETMAMITSRDTYIISKQKMCFAFSDGLSAVQMAARQVVIELVSQELSVHLLTEMEIKAVYMSKNTVALHCSDKLIFYEVNFDDKKTMHLGTFAVSSNCILLHDQSVYVKSEGKIDVKTFQGTLKAYFQFTKDEGEPLVMGASGDFFVAASTTSVTKIWDISGREAKLVLSSNDAKNIIKDKQITSIACNHKGNKVSFTVCIKTKTGSIFDPHLFVWDIEKNVFSQFDFATGQGNKPDDKISNTSDLSAMVSGRFPVQHFWVQEDPRLVVCEAKLLPLPLKKNFANSSFRKMLNKQKKNSIVDTEKKPETVVVSLYVTPDKVLIVQDYFALDENQANLLGVKIPYYYILQKKADPAPDEKVQEVKGHKSLVERKTMQNFIGLESCDNATKEALLNFSYFFAAGSFDEAFSAIKTIDSESVWENMAKMCVKTKRLDVAKICVGKMGLTFAIKALNKAAKEPQLEVKIGILAIHLEMYDEAEKLFRSCGRYDWVNKLCQCRGQWQKALEIAEAKDRIHLRDTFYNYANFLEREGDIHNAIKFYEKSGTHHFEIPRMLFDDPRALEAYVQKSKDPEIHRWWAQYLESIDEMETALHYYKTAEDYLSLVRLYCYCNNLEKAAEIANETGNRAACFHLGRQFENQDNIKEAIHFFTQARAFTNAIRICKENNLEEQLMNLAMMAGPAEKADVAQHFQQQGNISNAISLYHKAGNLEYAVELAFQEGEYDVLQKIATELPPDADPQLLQQCAEFFIQRGRFDTAVNLFIMAKKYEEALNLCVENNVKIGEELAEKFTLDKNETDKQLRIFILEKIGESCMIQENYHLAAKKFTQAGDKIKAMKALLKSGDTDRIIFFANVSRQREIYVMAANYLQTLDWRNNGDVVKHIITFYTKGKALDLLSSFYEACAQDEIDEYQNYEKALEALTEAYKCQAKNSGSSNSDKLQTLKSKIEIISKFVEIRHLYESNPEDAVKECRDLLHLENVEAAVRRGDIYGFLVEHFCSRENYKVAYSILEQMQSTLPGINLPYYIKVDNLKAIYKALDLKPHKENEFSVSKKDSENDLSDTEEIEEEYQAVENRFL
ncbi:intraflagellar transport protein 140 homolog [Uloborus diversus]|uniref:intraflagellar transport protein 140 homolog n=1 Tax=Uloborus diversus TaxID=327109 RepID=UPI002409908A|nr:intraflagellar transport protein 140 homolog [Uloborus diversus]